MEASRAATSVKYRKVGGMMLTVALAALIGGLSLVPAQADDHDQGRNVQRGRSQNHPPPPRRDNRDYYGYQYNGYGGPSYYYAPPPVYYAPLPGPPIIDFVFPLNFR